MTEVTEPRRPIMLQTWRDLLFAHWPIAPSALRPLIPPGLELDLWDGEAWVGVVPFRMTGIRPFGMPAVPRWSETLELNVRTYVRPTGQPEAKPGVYFFSLDAASRIAVRIARRFFHLPYFDAAMQCHAVNNRCFLYRSRRKHPGSPETALQVEYEPRASMRPASSGTAAFFLTERYCLYTTDPRGRLLRGDVQHEPWPLQSARAHFTLNTMTKPLHFVLPDTEPLLHFSRQLDVRIGKLVPC